MLLWKCATAFGHFPAAFVSKVKLTSVKERSPFQYPTKWNVVIGLIMLEYKITRAPGLLIWTWCCAWSCCCDCLQ